MSLTQIAAEAGVAASTVSRYVRGQLKVAPETARRIDAALQSSGQAVNPRAEAADTIGLVVPGISNPYFAVLADAVADAAASAGLDVLTALTGSSARRERSAVAQLAQLPHVRGIVYLGMNSTNSALDDPAVSNLPVVFLDEVLERANPLSAHVTSDNFGGAYQATTHLIRLGHRHIAHLGGPRGLVTADDRERGYRAALQDHQVPADDDLVVRGPFSAEFGTNFFAHMSRARVRPSAVFSASDIGAIGIMEAAHHASIGIPRELSLIGCDGIMAGNWTSPRLTTVVQPVEAMARHAVTEIQAMRSGRPASSQVLPMSLQVRDSTRGVDA